MELQNLSNIIEAVLLVSEKPLKVQTLVELFERREKVTEDELVEAIGKLKEKYAAGLSGIEIQEVAGGIQFVTKRELSIWVKAFLKSKTIIKLTRSSIETLAIVAYKQPITKGEIDHVRGVDSSNPIKSLLFKKLVRIAGRKKAPGNPLMYSTTEDFLRYFGLKGLEDLPTVEEIENVSVSPEAADENETGDELEAETAEGMEIPAEENIESENAPAENPAAETPAEGEDNGSN